MKTLLKNINKFYKKYDTTHLFDGELGDYINAFENGKEHNTKALAIFKLCVSIFCTMCIGAFIAVWIECGYDLMLVVGIALAIFLAVCSGIGAYEDVKECE